MQDADALTRDNVAAALKLHFRGAFVNVDPKIDTSTYYRIVASDKTRVLRVSDTVIATLRDVADFDGVMKENGVYALLEDLQRGERVFWSTGSVCVQTL